MDFDLEGARKAGYSDDEIAAYLSKQKNFDKDAAEKAGYSPLEIINHLQPQAAPKETAPKSGKAAANAEAVSGFQELFGRDPSKAGKLTGSDYAARIAAGTATGGAIGAGIGLVTGPGAIVTGTVGAIGGATSSLISAFLEDAGFGEGTQIAGGMLVPGGMGTKVGKYIESKVVDKLITSSVKKATGLPGVGPVVQKGREFLESRRPVDVEAASKVLGEKADTLGIAGTKFTDETQAALTKEYPNLSRTAGMPLSHDLYQGAKNEADKLAFPTSGGLGGQPFSATSEYSQLTKGIAAREEKFDELFKSPKGNPLEGKDIIENLKEGKAGIRFDDLQEARKAFNNYLENNGLPRLEEKARAAFEKESIAAAKDKLPNLFETKSAEGIKDQLRNLGKSEEGLKIFKQELLTHLQNVPASEARQLWAKIGTEVRRQIIRDPEQFRKITEIIKGAQTQKEIGRAARLILQTAIPTTIAEEKNL
jgi:hypothetical protein